MVIGAQKNTSPRSAPSRLHAVHAPRANRSLPPPLAVAADVLSELHRMESPKNRAGMARYGIRVDNALGVSVPDLRKLAKRIAPSRQLAEQLWATGNHEARLLAGFICPVESVDEELAEAWVADFDSWDLCDQVMDLFASSDFGWKKAVEWCGRDEEFVRRTGFAMFAGFAVHDKTAGNTKFIRTCFPQIRKHAGDERNFVKKAVNWALRNIGKRNEVLNAKAIEVARALAERQSASARWIGHDALRELTSEKIQKRLIARGGRKRGPDHRRPRGPVKPTSYGSRKRVLPPGRRRTE